MSTNPINPAPYIRTSREFPLEVKDLSFQLNLTYVDLAQAINVRTIGLFSNTLSSNTGEAWYLRQNRKQQAFQQVYPFTTTANIPHNINLNNIYGFVNMYGDYTDGTNWYGLIPGSSVALTGQISFYVTPTDIVFVVDAGAPALTSGNIVLKWLSLT